MERNNFIVQLNCSTIKLLGFAVSFEMLIGNTTGCLLQTLYIFTDFLKFCSSYNFLHFFKTFEEILISNFMENGEMRTQHVSNFTHLVNCKTYVTHFYVTAWMCGPLLQKLQIAVRIY
jgi:hypothetical protein